MIQNSSFVSKSKSTFSSLELPPSFTCLVNFMRYTEFPTHTLARLRISSSVTEQESTCAYIASIVSTLALAAAKESAVAANRSDCLTVGIIRTNQKVTIRQGFGCCCACKRLKAFCKTNFMHCKLKRIRQEQFSLTEGSNKLWEMSK